MRDAVRVKDHPDFRTVRQVCPSCESCVVVRHVPKRQFPVLPVNCCVCVARMFGYRAHVAQPEEAQARGA